MVNLFGIFLLISFVAYIMYFGLSDRLMNGFAIQAVGEFFIAGTIVFSLLAAIAIYKKEILDRIGLAIILFGLIGSLVFLGNNSIIMYYFNEYIRIIPFICLFLIGLITTFYTPSGFIGVLSEDKRAIRFISLKLLALVIVGGLWSLFIKNYLDGYFIYLIAPLMIVRWMYDRWSKQLRGEKVFNYSFKW